MDEDTENEGAADSAAGITRRSFLAGAGAAAAGFASTRRGSRGLSKPGGELIQRALNVGPSTGGGLSEVEHVVILMQENRSFDHYFGTMSGVRGFSDPHALHQVRNGVSYPIFDQFGYEPGMGVTNLGFLQPFHLLSKPPLEDGQTTNDITHNWGPQHLSWNNGKMDSFVTQHIAVDGAQNGPVSMGYFTRADLAFYYALADAFTICDAYHCSVLGPTDPNRVMSVSGTIDPAGAAGGPVLVTQVSQRQLDYGKMTWETMPERLSAAGVTWKVYNDPTSLLELSPFPYFKQYVEPSLSQLQLQLNGIDPIYPVDFVADVALGTLPAVSWIQTPLAMCEHPAAPPEYGEYLVQTVLNTLVSNPEVWAKTVLFITYDENGGFFDHVPPITPPAGTQGEYLTVKPLPADAAGIAGPVGLGFRVPCLVVSPFSAGGWVNSDVLDHTSLLRFLETRFGATVPNLSPWRRNVTGNMTGTLPMLVTPRTAVPPLPQTSIGDLNVAEQAVINALAGTADVGVPYPLPSRNSMPTQARSPVRRRTPH